jgi:hypothetical protein
MENVWDYPRPPRLEPAAQQLRILFAGRVIAATTAGFRVLETSHPPVYYLPPSAFTGIGALGLTTVWRSARGGATRSRQRVSL